MHEGLLYDHNVEAQLYIIRGLALSAFLNNDTLTIRIESTDDSSVLIDSIRVVPNKPLPAFSSTELTASHSLDSDSIGSILNVRIAGDFPTIVSIQIANAKYSQSTCTDTDGDDWGWTGDSSCIAGQ